LIKQIISAGWLFQNNRGNYISIAVPKTKMAKKTISVVI